MAVGFGFMGLGELLIALLALGGFGPQANPKAPSVQQIVRYGVPDADFVLFADLDAVVPSGLKLINEAAKNPLLTQLPNIGSKLQQVPQMIAKARAKMVQAIGMDPIRDVRWAGAWLKLQGDRPPEFIVVLSGAIPDSFVRLVAQSSGEQISDVDGRPIVRAPGNMRLALGSLADGTHIFGTTASVEARLRKTWRGSKGGEAAKFLAGKPAYAMVSKPRPNSRLFIRKQLSGDDLTATREFLATHEFLGLAVHHNQLRWAHRATGAVTHRAVALASEGIIQLLRAGHHATRGLTRVVLARLEGFTTNSPEVAAILKHRDVLLKFVDQYSGDGRFKAKVAVKAKTRTVTVSAKAKRLTHIVPMGAMIPVFVGAWLTFGGDSRDAPTEHKSQPTTEPVTDKPAATGP